MSNKEYISYWFSVNIFAAKILKAIHPDDLELFASDYKYRGQPHKCVALEKEYLVIKYLDQQFRIKADFECLSIFPTPYFLPNEKVQFTSSKEEISIGVIAGIYHHHRRKAHFYELIVGGKKKSKRYFDNDLRKLS